MIFPSQFTVVLDACVLCPAPLRDILLSLGAEGLYRPKWTYLIQDEWTRNLLQNRPDISNEQLQRTTNAMDMAFPDATVESFEKLIDGLTLPDKDDRHVLACAIQCNANLITTFNLKDFPNQTTKKYDIEVQHPDIFISYLIDQNKETSHKAFDKMIARLNNPPMSKAEVIAVLKKNGLKNSAEKLI